MPNKIILKKSSVPARAPVVEDLEYGELALNYADGKLFYKTSVNTIAELISSSGGSSVTVSETAPATPSSGDLWLRSSDLALFVWYVDTDSSQWVAVSGPQGIQGETGPGVPSGGLTNEYLVKASTTDYDLVWTDRVNAKTIYETVKNVTAESLAKGTPVYQTGIVGNTITVNVARADDPNKLAIGVLDETIAAEAEGRMLVLGEIKGVNTSAFSTGDKIYLGSTGGYTNIPPTDSTIAQQFLGIVLRVDATNGSGYITGTLSEDAIRYTGTSFEAWTGSAWNNLGNVVGPASSTANAVALFDGTTGKLLKDSAKALPTGDVVGISDTQTLSNKTIAFADNTLTGVQPTLVSGTNIKTINGSSLLGAGDLAISGGGASALTISNKTAAYTVVADDLGTIINCTSGTFTVSLTAAATLGAGFNVTIWNTGDGTVTIDPNNAETIDGTGTTYILRPRAGVELICTSTAWATGANKALRLYQESSPNDPNFTRPVATGFGSVAIGRSASSAGQGAVALGSSANASGEGGVAIGYATASGSNSISINNSTGLFNTLASATNSTAIGGNSSSQGSQAVTGSGAMALGGSYASGVDSFAAGVANNTSSFGATAANAIAIGKSAKATQAACVAIGEAAVASGTPSIAIGQNAVSSGTTSMAYGYAASASGDFSLALGRSATASGINSAALGFNSTAAQYGKYAYSASSSSYQTGTLILFNTTTGATATRLVSSFAATSATNQVILPNNSAYAFSGMIVARQQAAGGTASAAWKVEGLIRREGSAGTTVLVNSATTVIDNTPGWTLALSADTTNGGLAVTATGAAATNIRWVATIQTSEVTYA